MNPANLLAQFIAIVPDFEAHWNSDDNCVIGDDSSFTYHGVCAEFSHFFRDRSHAFAESQLTELFALVEQHVIEPAADDNALDNALCTCFLENIASEQCGQTAKRFMGRNSRSFFDQWHAWPQ